MTWYWDSAILGSLGWSSMLSIFGKRKSWQQTLTSAFILSNDLLSWRNPTISSNYHVTKKFGRRSNILNFLWAVYTSQIIFPSLLCGFPVLKKMYNCLPWKDNSIPLHEVQPQSLHQSNYCSLKGAVDLLTIQSDLRNVSTIINMIDLTCHGKQECLLKAICLLVIPWVFIDLKCPYWHWSVHKFFVQMTAIE